MAALTHQSSGPREKPRRPLTYFVEAVERPRLKNRPDDLEVRSRQDGSGGTIVNSGEGYRPPEDV